MKEQIGLDGQHDLNICFFFFPCIRCDSFQQFDRSLSLNGRGSKCNFARIHGEYSCILSFLYRLWPPVINSYLIPKYLLVCELQLNWIEQEFTIFWHYHFVPQVWYIITFCKLIINSYYTHRLIFNLDALMV